MNTKLNTAFIATALVATSALSAPLLAQTSNAATTAAPNKTVRYSDLDLSTAAGIGALYKRIQDAAWHVCLEMVPGRNGPTGIENVNCRQTLVDLAVEEVNKPALTALHTGKRPDHRTAGRRR